MAGKKVSRVRRSSPKRRHRLGLTRERVVAEARRVVEAHGVEALSMRALAHRLGVSTMAIYNHVTGKHDLIGAIAQGVVQEFRAPSGDGDWRERVRVCFRALRQVCLANPRLIPLVETVEVLHPAVFRPMEGTLAALQEAGIDLQEALQAYFLLTNFTMGQVSYEIRGPFRGLDPAEAVRRGAILASEFPLVAKAAFAGQWDFDVAFELGLKIIVEGLAAHAARAMRGR